MYFHGFFSHKDWFATKLSRGGQARLLEPWKNRRFAIWIHVGMVWKRPPNMVDLPKWVGTDSDRPQMWSVLSQTNIVAKCCEDISLFHRRYTLDGRCSIAIFTRWSQGGKQPNIIQTVLTIQRKSISSWYLGTCDPCLQKMVRQIVWLSSGVPLDNFQIVLQLLRSFRLPKTSSQDISDPFNPRPIWFVVFKSCGPLRFIDWFTHTPGHPMSWIRQTNQRLSRLTYVPYRGFCYGGFIACHPHLFGIYRNCPSQKKKYGLHTLRTTNSQVCPKNGCLKHKSCPFSKLAKIFQSSFKTQLIH